MLVCALRVFPRLGTRLGLAIALLVSSAGAAFAQDQRDASGERDKTLVLVEPEPLFLKAVATALSPWAVHVVAVDRPTPGASMPGSATQARAVARERAADAVAWISGSSGARALWVYDSAEDKVVALEVEATSIPFDEASAAAVALTLKTLLRHSLAAPSGERYGAPPAAPAVPVEPVAPPAPETVSDEPPRLSLDLRGGPRLRASGQLEVEPRIGLIVASSPRGWRPLSVGIALSGGPGIAVDEPTLIGRYTDLAAGARLGMTTGSGRFALQAALGASAHFTRLEGVVSPGGQDVDAWRLDPSLDAEVRVDTRLVGSIRLGAFVEGNFLLKRQRYQVGDEVVLRLARLETELGIVVTMPIYW